MNKGSIRLTIPGTVSDFRGVKAGVQGAGHSAPTVKSGKRIRVHILAGAQPPTLIQSTVGWVVPGQLM